MRKNEKDIEGGRERLRMEGEKEMRKNEKDIEGGRERLRMEGEKEMRKNEKDIEGERERLRIWRERKVIWERGREGHRNVRTFKSLYLTKSIPFHLENKS
uniref:Uncharacterized protein n=1 Tax=Cacopsylla melanoneura TaxID=428564 RepID=A0A8D9ETB1_9HEMI